jgi:hypothetical protein
MKSFIFSIYLILGIASFNSLWGQVTPITPAVPDNASPQDTSIKMRSAELERVKRDAAKAEAEKFAPINTEIMAKFPQIKEDFEAIQILEAAIIKGYTTGKTIDYNLIEICASEINKHAKRLDSNLFAETKKEKKEQNSVIKEEKAKNIKDLIIDLDNAIGNFVSSKIFGNLKVIEPEVAVSTRNDLLKIRNLSQKLADEAKKLK